MQRAQEPRPRAKSPFVAAVLSLVFPGLGHAYAGAYHRAVGFAAPPILLGALIAGIVLRIEPTKLIEFVLWPPVLPSIFVLNLLALVYRLVAIVDAYRVTAFLNAATMSGGGRLGRPRLAFNTLSVAGLLAAILVMAGAHVVVAKYDLQASDFLGDPCVFLANDTDGAADCVDDSPDPSASPSPGAGLPSDEPTDSPEPTPSEPPVQGSALPNASIEPWDGKDRLNILLIGSDQRPNEGTYNTDTLIVVSIDPVSKQVAMFALPRDSTNLPLPSGSRLASAFGGFYPNKINSLFTQTRNRSDLVAGTNRTRGYNALKAVLGNLYQLDIKYFVEVNFQGFKSVVDAVGGVTINVQVPVIDDSYPADSGRHARVYIPAGIQHMNGAQALVYARSRHGSDDFDRGFRQQRVLTSLREQANIGNLVPRIPQLLKAFKQTVKTDIPQAELAKLAGLASGVDSKNIRSYVFSYPRYGSQILAPIYKYLPNVGKIRAAVASAFKVDPQLEATRAALGDENGSIWVLNGGGPAGRATSLAAYLEFYGLIASAPTTRPDVTGLANTRIVIYNGAEARLPETIQFLEKKFGVQVELKQDVAVHVDVIVSTGTATPNLAPPPSS